jgi:hypothetical protein
MAEGNGSQEVDSKKAQVGNSSMVMSWGGMGDTGGERQYYGKTRRGDPFRGSSERVRVRDKVATRPFFACLMLQGWSPVVMEKSRY